MTNEELIAEADASALSTVQSCLGALTQQGGLILRLITALREAEAENALLRDPDRHTRFVQITLQRDEARQEVERLQSQIDDWGLSVRMTKIENENARLRAAIEPLVKIADAYDDNHLDDEARKEWAHGVNTRPFDQIELYTGRGGRRLLTLQDCMTARRALGGEP